MLNLLFNRMFIKVNYNVMKQNTHKQAVQFINGMYLICEGLCHFLVAKHLTLSDSEKTEVSIYRYSCAHTHRHRTLLNRNTCSYRFSDRFQLLLIPSRGSRYPILSFSLHSFNGTLVPVVEIHLSRYLEHHWCTDVFCGSCSAMEKVLWR